jgi:hypothetical protein
MSKLSESIISLRSMLDTAEIEIKALESGKKAASSRSRKSLQNIKTGSHALRKQITQFSKGLPTKPRAKKEIVCPSHAAVEACNIDEEVETPKPEVAPKPVKKTRKTKPKIEKIPITKEE